MEEAWELTTAHREDLAGRPGNPQAAPMLQDRPSVMGMIRGVWKESCGSGGSGEPGGYEGPWEH